MQQFNIDLCKLSRLYERCIKLKRRLRQYDEKDILIQLHQHKCKLSSLLTKQQSGYLSKNIILQWMINQEHKLNSKNNLQQQNQFYVSFFNQDKQTINNLLNQLLPFNQVSYSTLITLSLKGAQNFISQEQTPIQNNVLDNNQQLIKQINNQSNQQSNQLINAQQLNTQLNTSQIKKQLNKQQSFNLIIGIILCEIKMIQLKKNIIPLIQLYIPMSQKNLTIQQLKDYILLVQYKHHNQINPTYIIQALNGTYQSHSNHLQYQFYKLNNNQNNQNNINNNQINTQQNQSNKNKLNQIHSIMQRLNQRVDNFGKQWLIDPPQYLNKHL